MPELPDDDPRIDEFSTKLSHDMVRFIGREVDRSTVQKIHDVVEIHRTRFKQNYGYDAPPIVALVLPTSRYIGLYRADLETPQIQIVVLNMLRQFAVQQVPVSKKELALALCSIWPHYDPAMEFFAADGQAKGAFIN